MLDYFPKQLHILRLYQQYMRVPVSLIFTTVWYCLSFCYNHINGHKGNISLWFSFKNSTFYILLDSAFQSLMKDLCVYIHKRYWSAVSLWFFVSFWCLNSRLIVENYSFLFYFLKKFVKDCYCIFLKYLIEFTNEAIWV